MTHLRKIMLEELPRRHYSEATIDWSRWPTGKSPFVGETPLTTMSRS